MPLVPKINLGLRGRFVAANMALAIILIGGFALAVHRFLELVRAELVTQHLARELATYESAVRADATTLPALPKGFLVYLIRKGNYHGFLRDLAKYSPGIHPDVLLNGQAYTLGRRDIGDDSLFLLLQSELDAVNILESELWRIAIFAGGVALVIAVAVALWLARIVLRPVQRLAANARRIAPGEPRLPLAHFDSDPAINAIAQAFEQVLDRYDELVEREREFNRDASHELRTPLAVIATSAELLANGASIEPPQRVRIGRIRAATEQMRALVEGLLLLARPEAERSLIEGDCRASDVVSEAIRLQTQDASATAQVTFVVIQDHVLRQPRGLLLCVANNLLRNALVHSGSNSINVTLTPQGLEIEDHGRGIPPAELAQLFARHVRGRDSAGEGLGLFIVRRICERVNWRIELETPAGGGARFILNFDAPPVVAARG